MFKKYNTIADYELDPLPLEESRVSLIMKDNYGNTIDEIKYDSVGRTTKQPLVGDVCCLDENNNIKFLVGGKSLSGSLPIGWTLVGFVYNRLGNKVRILNKAEGSYNYISCWQFSITDISSTSLTIRLRMKNNYASNTSVTVALTSAEINQTSATEISNAVADKAASVGDTNAWWAWYDHAITVGGVVYKQDSANNVSGNDVDAPYCWTNGNDHVYTKTESVETRGTNAASNSNTAYSDSVTSSANSFDIIAVRNRIIIQTDTVADYRQYNVSGSGCTIRNCTFEGITANYLILRKNLVSNSIAVMHTGTALNYYAGRGTEPSSNVAINSATIVKKSSFETSEYCSALRSKYGNYQNYLEAQKVKNPQKYGAFNLPDGAEISRLLANETCPTKTGGTKYKFPGLRACATVSYNDVNGLLTNSWHLSDISEGAYFMDDEVMKIVAESQSKLGVLILSTDRHRRFSTLANDHNTWYYYKWHGTLMSIDTTDVSGYFMAVCTLDLTQINQSNS